MGNRVPGRSGWRVAAANAAGPSQLRDGLPNQDAVAHRLVEAERGQVVVIAVADGTGSAQPSDAGSNIAAATGVEALSRGIGR